MKNKPDFKPVLPINFFVQGRRCLVVGGGKVAARKASHLLEAEACVVLVSPEVDEEILSLAKHGKLEVLQRPFQDTDVDGAFLVNTATDDIELNRHILELCHLRGILCSSADSSWPEGDFLTPAIFRKDNLTVTISTGGQSCRRSRLIKDNLARHVEMVEAMDLMVLGTSHHQLSLEERSPYHLLEDHRREIGRMLMMVWGIHEFLLLNTCNRIELVATVSNDECIPELAKRILSFDHLRRDQFYLHRGYDAFAHVSLTSAGLLSQTPGENNIVAQIKSALDEAVAAQWAAGMMQEWIAAALHISKHIRQDVGGLLRNLEIEDLAVEYASAHGSALSAGHSPLIVGAGAVGRGLVDRLAAKGISCCWCYHTEKPELEHAWGSRVTVFPWNELEKLLPESRMIFVATGSENLVIAKPQARHFSSGQPVLLLDLGTPRQVDTALRGKDSSLQIADLDDLKIWYRNNHVDMEEVLSRARDMIGQHRTMYDKLVASFKGRHAQQ